MNNDIPAWFNNPGQIGDSLTQLLRSGARELIEKAVEAELVELLEQYRKVTDLLGRRAVGRRRVFTGAGSIDRAGASVGAGPQGTRSVR